MKITQQTISIDGIDKIIIKHLLEDARTPIQILANTSGISGAAVHQRLKKLEKAQVIKGSQVILNPKILVWFIAIYSQFMSADNKLMFNIYLVSIAGIVDACWYIILTLAITTSPALSFLLANVSTNRPFRS